MTIPARWPLLLATLFIGLAACGGPAEPAKTSAAKTLNAEGLRRLHRGELDGASEMFRAALREAELVDDLPAQAEAWNNLGALAMAQDDAEEARLCHLVALRLHAATPAAPAARVRTRENLGAAELALGHLAAARAQFEAAVKVADETGASDARLARVGLAGVHLSQGDYPSARRLAARAGEAARAAGDRDAEASALAVEGAALEGLGHLAEAEARYRSALSIDREREEPQAVRSHLRALGRLAERRGDREAAAFLFTRCARISRWLGQLPVATDELARARRHAKAGVSRGTDAALKLERKLLEAARARSAALDGGAPLPASNAPLSPERGLPPMP